MELSFGQHQKKNFSKSIFEKDKITFINNVQWKILVFKTSRKSIQGTNRATFQVGKGANKLFYSQL
jgi:hypothetical protein